MTLRIARLLAAIGVCLSIGGLLFVAKAQAQPRPVVCMPLAALVEFLKERKGEEKAWEGSSIVRGYQIKTMLFQSDANTWTLAASQGTQACIIGMGTDATPVVTGQDA
jgi:hypothetical protein